MKQYMRTLLSACLAGTLVLSSYPAPALADTADDLQVAAQRLEELGGELTQIQAELDACGEELEACSYDMAQMKAQVTQTEEDLAAAREVLANRMRTNYKAGNTSLLSVILGAGCFEELVSRIYYMDKVSTSDAAAVAEVEALQFQLNDQLAALEARQHDLERTLEATQARVVEYEEKVAEAAEYYNSLDAQLQEELAAQAAAEAEAREREEAEALARAMEAVQEAPAASSQAKPEPSDKPDEPKAEDDSTSTKDSESDEKESSKPTDDSKESEPAPEPAEKPSEEAKPEPQPTPEPAKEEPQKEPEKPAQPERPSTPAVTYNTFGGAGVDSAYSCIGCPYEYASAGPNSFDCSGLVCYCYGYGRGRSTYDMIQSLKSTGDWKTDMSQLSYGDLIFTSNGHVGIYLGNGTFIHAPAPGRTVCVQSVFSFVGGGTY